MFTGLVRGLGEVSPLGSHAVRVRCHPDSCAAVMAGAELGDSIAVDGVCLTVTRLHTDGFEADVSPETLRRTRLGQGSHLANLEPSLRVGDKLGGHFVSGHVDGTGELIVAQPSADGWELDFAAPAPVARYIVEKGSIAINGISLTVAQCWDGGRRFRVAVIPLTYAETNLGRLQPGDPVNLEGDMLGKYVEKFLGRSESPIDLAFLREHGYG